MKPNIRSTKTTAAVAAMVMLAPMLHGAAPHAADFSPPAWSPYLVGAGIGILTWLTMALSSKPVGASSAYATTAGLIASRLAPEHTSRLKYYKDHPPRLSWELIFVIGAILGGLLAAWHGGELTFRWLPPFWEARFGGDSLPLRAGVALLGGILMAYGARMAGGCTSGHGISGALQLNVASWTALVCFFVGGVALAHVIY